MDSNAALSCIVRKPSCQVAECRSEQSVGGGNGCRRRAMRAVVGVVVAVAVAVVYSTTRDRSGTHLR